MRRDDGDDALLYLDVEAGGWGLHPVEWIAGALKWVARALVGWWFD